ncbi:MAG: hypothetical protein H3C64_01725, partial [Candidatus Kuenenia stuttgartiensis]|nr:hypothetical protein [Candidatus Kuenenia stuttgartiensis]
MLNGEDALKHLNTQPPLFAFLDTELPILDGFQVCKLMKSSLLANCNNVPVILVTDSQKNCMISLLANCVGAYLSIHPSFALEDLLYLLQ